MYKDEGIWHYDGREPTFLLNEREMIILHRSQVRGTKTVTRKVCYWD